MNVIQSVYSFNTKLPADTVEWCPDKNNLLVCGTYNLDKETSQRHGEIQVFELNCEETELELIRSIETSAVLDSKWGTLSDNKSVLATANASGSVELFELKGNSLESIGKGTCSSEESCLALSVDFLGCRVLASDSKGCVNLFDFGDSTSEALRWTGHEYEAWIAAFDRDNQHIVYSGGDDCCLCVWDLRSDVTSSASIKKKNAHQMGITSINSRGTQLITGSYDEQVVLWDSRQMKISLSSSKVGGGIWRIKRHPRETNTILTACMHAGFHVLKITPADIQITHSFLEHESLAYGADWQHNGNSVASCSFYDCKLCIWKYSE